MRKLRVVAPVALVAIVVASLITIAAGAGTANAVPLPCDRQGGIVRFRCAYVTDVPGNGTIPLRQKAALDADPVSGTAYGNGTELVLDCWATSPVHEGAPRDSYWFYVFNPNNNKEQGYISDINLTTGSFADWSDYIGECSGNEPEPVQEGVFQCEYAGGFYHADCAKVTAVSDLSYLHLLAQPDISATHLTGRSFNTGDELALDCWITGNAVAGDPYWFKVFNPNDTKFRGYVNDYYLATGSEKDWIKDVPTECSSTANPPAIITKMDNGFDPHGSFQICPRRNRKPYTDPIDLPTKAVTVTDGNEIETRNTGVQKIGSVQNCLAIHSLSPTRGAVFSWTHVRLGDHPKWDLTSRVLGLTTTFGLGLQFRQGSLTTVYPPYQLGCHPHACRSETYFLTRAYGPNVTGHVDFVQRRADYDFQSRPNPAPVCDGQYQSTTVRAGSDPGGDNFETTKTGGLQSVIYQQAGWTPVPGGSGRVTARWSSANTFDSNMWGDEARDRVALRFPGSRVEVHFRVNYGNSFSDRYVDVLTADGTAIEVKTGLPNRSLAEQQAKKDAALVKDGAAAGVRRVEWIFFPSPVTGKTGPEPALEAQLKAAGIKVVTGPAAGDIGQLCR